MVRGDKDLIEEESLVARFKSKIKTSETFHNFDMAVRINFFDNGQVWGGGGEADHRLPPHHAWLPGHTSSHT